MPPAVSRSAAGARPSLELADVIRVCGEAYRQRFQPDARQRRVMNAIEACRTAAIGGHVESCEACGLQRIAYNSCRNRHCPKCQGLARTLWIDQRQAELLPVPYFHLVFTLPHQLNGLVLGHPRTMFSLLFQAVSRTLLQFGHNNLRGRPGFSLILHTWDQTLGFHVHLHCVMAGGALALDPPRWSPASTGFLFSVHALSKVFRSKFLDGLQDMHRREKLSPASSAPQEFDRLLRSLWQKPWVVYAKAPFGGPRQVLNYLGRYTHRIAISNDRLQHFDPDNDRVTFAYRDRAHGNVQRSMTLEAGEFIRRFLMHVLPSGFVRIRHYGFLASRVKTEALKLCRQLLDVPDPDPDKELPTTAERILQLTGVDINRCPRCSHSPLTRTEFDGARPPP